MSVANKKCNMITKYTLVSLNGAFSKLIPPGEIDSTNPKSI